MEKEQSFAKINTQTNPNIRTRKGIEKKYHHIRGCLQRKQSEHFAVYIKTQCILQAIKLLSGQQIYES